METDELLLLLFFFFLTSLQKRNGLTDLWFPRRKRGGQGEMSWFRLTYTHYSLQSHPQGPTA